MTQNSKERFALGQEISIMLKQNSNTDLLTLKPAFLSFFKPGPQACCPHCEMRLIKSTDEVSLY